MLFIIMNKKPLHEKKISELDGFNLRIYEYRQGYCLYTGEKGNENFKYSTLKQWAIVIIKNCNDCVYIKDEYSDTKKKLLSRCETCKRYMYRFEIVEDDLK